MMKLADQDLIYTLHKKRNCRKKLIYVIAQWFPKCEPRLPWEPRLPPREPRFITNTFNNFIFFHNFISIRKVSHSKANFFEKRCEDMRSEHTSLLYYCTSRWFRVVTYCLARLNRDKNIFIQV